MPRALGKNPEDRPNWVNLNEGQRRYAMEQWNLARIRRGLTIDHPIPESDPEPEIREDSSPDIPQEVYQGGGDLDDITDEQFDELDGIFNPKQPDKQGEPEVPEEPEINLPGYEDYRTGKTMSAAAQPMDTAQTPPKRQRTEDAGGSRPRGLGLKGTGMKLPGTAGGIGGGIDTAGQDVIPIPRPSLPSQHMIRSYKKVHRFITFGLAYTPIVVPRGTAPDAWNDIFMVTPMAEIPWDRLFMYLNPSEFALLPDGSHVTEMRCQVRSENVRIAFPTNSTTTNLATLNQNKFLRIAHGLRQNLQGVHVRPSTFDDNQPMITTAIEEVPDGYLYEEYITAFYGSPNNDAAFLTETPRHQFGLPYPLQFYYTPVTQDNDFTASGWSQMQSYISEVEADSRAGTEVASVTYKPQDGMINQPLNTIYTGIPSGVGGETNIVLSYGTGNAQMRTVTTQIGENAVTQQTEAFSDFTEGSNQNPVALGQLIEKSQVQAHGFNPQFRAKTCPSLHVGIQPVIALTSKSIGGQAVNSYTDSQAYFEVVCECDIAMSYPTDRPLATRANVPPGAVTYFPSVPRANKISATMVNGLYQAIL